MTFLELVLVVAALALAFHAAVMFALACWDGPAELPRADTPVLRPERLDGHGEVIGHYGGAAIYRSVRFGDMEYEFAGVVPRRAERRIDANELCVEPGLLYVLRCAG